MLAEGCCTFCHYIFHCQLFSTGYTNLNSHFVITILVDTKAYKSNRQMPAVQSDSNERNVLFFFLNYEFMYLFSSKKFQCYRELCCWHGFYLVYIRHITICVEISAHLLVDQWLLSVVLSLCVRSDMFFFKLISGLLCYLASEILISHVT